jgi:hypothetical protein
VDDRAFLPARFNHHFHVYLFATVTKKLKHLVTRSNLIAAKQVALAFQGRLGCVVGNASSYQSLGIVPLACASPQVAKPRSS